jgi:hypothetical protein
MGDQSITLEESAPHVFLITQHPLDHHFPSSPIMSLSDLVDYTPAQRQAISQLNPTDLCASGLPEWDRFRETLWGTGLESLQQEELVERDDDPVEDIHILPDSLPTTCSVVTPPEIPPNVWNPFGRRILVRSEYYEAERAAVLANNEGRDVFVVTGQPGIGPPPSLSVACRI